MLETDAVDVDLFTANPGTSLATIFSSAQVDQDNDKTSLKYIPQVPSQPPQPAQEIIDDKTKTKSPTNCILAAAVLGYEWVNNTYNIQKKLSLAIIKLEKENAHQIILYNSEKKILSMASISSVFIVNVKKDVSFSYYDNYKKYWLICGAGNKINKIIDCLKELKVNINYSIEEKDLPENMNDNVDGELQIKDNTESDTDSSRNIKNKDTILRRMAAMGHSVLPSNEINSQSSESTNEDESTLYYKLLRHKLTKNLYKNKKLDKPTIPKKGNNLDSHKVVPITAPLNKNCDLPIKQEIAIPNIASMNSPSFVVNTNCDMNNFITEQRINNAELRINFNRMTDKLEQLLLLKTKDTEFNKTHLTTNQTIMAKLLKEYETKINSYENFFKSKGLDCNLLIASCERNDVQSCGDNEQIVNKQLTLLCEEKDREIEQLTKELQATKLQISPVDHTKTDQDSLSNDIIELKKAISEKNDVINKLDTNIQHILAFLNQSGLSNKVKKIMNGTYQTISSHFDDEVNYSGAKIKIIVGNVIKNSTLEALHDIENDSSNIQ